MHLLLTRRRFLLLGRDLFLLLSAIPGVFYAQDRLGAAKVLNAEQRDILLALAVTLFRNEKTGAELYRDAVLAIDAECVSDAQTKQIVRGGLAQLGKAFSRMAPGQRVQALKSQERSAFFQVVYAAMLRSVHGDRRTWKAVQPDLVPA